MSDGEETVRITGDQVTAARAKALGLGPGEPEVAALPQRRRGVVWLDARAAEAMLRLPPGQRVVSVNVDWLRDGIAFIVEGPGLPIQDDGMEPERLPADTYVDFHLLDKVRALAERWPGPKVHDQEDELHALLIGTLSGRFDPRTDLPS